MSAPTVKPGFKPGYPAYDGLVVELAPQTLLTLPSGDGMPAALEIPVRFSLPDWKLFHAALDRIDEAIRLADVVLTEEKQKREGAIDGNQG